MKNKTSQDQVGILLNPKNLTFKKRVKHIWNMIVGNPVILIGNVIRNSKETIKDK